MNAWLNEYKNVQNGCHSNHFVRACTYNGAHNQVTVFAIENMWPTKSLTHIMGLIQGKICTAVSVCTTYVRFVEMEPVQELFQA
jgi:hypothetical protein